MEINVDNRMSTQEFMFRYNLLNYLGERYAIVTISDKSLDDWTVKDVDGFEFNINPKEIYQDFLQSSIKEISNYFIGDSLYRSIEAEVNGETENRIYTEFII